MPLQLGIIVTLTHTIGVFILGAAVLLASKYVVAESIYPWLGFISGMLILAIGGWQLVRRLSGPAAQLDPHDPAVVASGRGHSHALPERITVASLMALGVSGGMVPCPSALVLLLASVALHRTAFGLALVGIFSLGLATVLILIGLLMLSARRFGERWMPTGGLTWFRYLPVASSIAVSVLGLLIALQSLRAGGQI